MRRLMMIGPAALLTLAAVAVGRAPADADPAAHARNAGPEPRLEEVLAGQVARFEVVDIDVGRLAEDLRAGKAVLPVADASGEVRDLELSARPAGLRAPSLTTGVLKVNGAPEKVPLGAEEAYRLGGCADDGICGSATIVDEAHTMVSGLVLSRSGVSWYQPVNLLLGTDEFPGAHVVYHDAHTIDLAIDDETEFCGPSEDRCPQPEGPDAEPPLDDDEEEVVEPTFVEAATGIVLDADMAFYGEAPATVFGRQLAIFNDIATMYEFIEPLSSENPETFRWKLDLTVTGQEAWVSGGPTDTDPDVLMSELVDPNYLLLNPLSDTDIHLLLLGYEPDRVRGKAAGIGRAAGGIGGAPGDNHAFVVARSGYSAKARWVIAAHEVGHLIGGTHAAGATNSCSFFLSAVPICGASIMAPGSAGPANQRAEYFTDANDRNIAGVISAVL